MCRCLGAASWLYVSALPIWKRCLLGEYVSQFSTSPTSRIEPEKSNDLNGGRTRARTWGPLIKRRFVLPIFLNNVSNLDASVQTATLPLTTALTLRSEEHTSELQSLMRISYAVFCLKKNNILHTLTPNISISRT